MQTSVTALSDVQVKIDVEIPAPEVSAEIEAQVREFRKHARIPGFRQGKAPRDLVVRQFGPQITSSATRQLIDRTVRPALQQSSRVPMGDPAIEPGLARDGFPLRYSIRVEVKPEVAVPEWQGIEVTVAPAVVTDEGVQEELGRLRERHKERVPVEDRGADTGDLLVVDGIGKLEGKPDPRLTVEGLEVRLGSGTTLPGLDDGLLGAKEGETRTITLVYPDDHSVEEMRGKPAELRMTVNHHFLEELPDLDDDFAQDVGFDTLEELREDCRQRLQRAADGRRTAELDRRVVAVLLERVKFGVPATLVRRQIEMGAQRLMQLMYLQGIPEATAKQILEASIQRLQGEAVRTVRRALVLDALATEQKIAVDDDALNAELVRRIQSGGDRVAKAYEDADQREMLRIELRERATLDLITRRAKITDADPAPAETPPTQPAEAAGDLP